MAFGLPRMSQTKIGENNRGQRELSGTGGLQLGMALDSPEMAHITYGTVLTLPGSSPVYRL